jgi:non-reducing end alpha-L-arabinofuranosidase
MSEHRSMRTRNVFSEISTIAAFGICCWGCTITSATQGADGGMGSGGDTTSGGTTGSGGGSTGSGGATVSGTEDCSQMKPPPAAPPAGTTKAPCDIYAEDGGPCVAAHSMVRALYATYDGPLYQVKKADSTTRDIGLLEPGGFANSADQDSFCGVDACTISIIYDQSGKGNHLTKGPAGGAKTTPDNEANAKAVSATFNGHKVYGVHVVPGIGYRNNSACGTTTGDNAETEYMVVAGDVSNGGCCFDYGNMERNSRDNGEGTMEAVYFGSCTIWGKGASNGPWVMGDLENGLWAGNISPYDNNKPITSKYVTAMVKGDAAGKNHWTIKSGNAQMGTLTTPFDGPRPSSRYNPMRKEGAIGLGTGGDNSAADTGNFFEGIMTTAYSSNAADDAVQASIVSVYGQ